LCARAGLIHSSTQALICTTTQVYSARYKGAEVAVKTLQLTPEDYGAGDAQLSDRMFASTSAEAATLSRLRHVNMMRFYGICFLPHLHCIAIVTELCALDLRKWMDNSGPRPDRDVWHAALQVANGLVYLHEDAGIVRVCGKEGTLRRVCVTTPFRLWEWLAGWLTAGVRLAAQRACVVSNQANERNTHNHRQEQDTATAAARQQHCCNAPAGRFAPTPALATLTQLKPLSPDEAPSSCRRAPPCCVSRLRPILRRLRRHRNLARSKKGAPGSQALQHSAGSAGRREAVRLGNF
jgi:hypothetical protein